MAGLFALEHWRRLQLARRYRDVYTQLQKGKRERKNPVFGGGGDDDDDDDDDDNDDEVLLRKILDSK